MPDGHDHVVYGSGFTGPLVFDEFTFGEGELKSISDYCRVWKPRRLSARQKKAKEKKARSREKLEFRRKNR